MSGFFQGLSGNGLICAHRGARSIAPENTPLALDKARTCGADLWETDVQMTADGELVLFHDRTLKRTTDITRHREFRERKPWPLSRFDLAELQSLNAGTWFLQTDPFGTLATGEVPKADQLEIERQRIPTLREALLSCSEHDFPVNLELKDQSGTAVDALIVQKVLELLKETATEPLVLLSSFNHAYLILARQLNPAVATAALVEKRHPKQLLDYLRKLQVDAYHPDERITDTALIQELGAAGLRVNFWTVNDVVRARELKAAGAGFICTDWPQRMLEL